MEVIGTAGLMLLVVGVYLFLKGPFWRIYTKIWPPVPKSIVKIDPADPYDLKARKAALADKQWTNLTARQAWQKDFDKLVKAACKHEWNTWSNRRIPFCNKCSTLMHMWRTYDCICDWRYEEYTNFHPTYTPTRLSERDRDCPDHGDEALKTTKK